MMARKLIALSGWVAAAVLAAVAASGYAHSQGAFPEGAFVVGSDGSRWVVGNGVRYRMSFIEGGAALGMMRDGGQVVATVAEANAALGLMSAPPTTARPPAAAPANPAETLVGQSVTACNYGVDFQIGVARVEWTRTVLNTTAPGNAMWIVALIDVTNLSTTAHALTTRPVQLRDARGREYNVREYPPDPVDLHRAYNVHAAFTNFEPGITEQSVVTFQVPGDVGPLTLVGKRDFC
jgi:hypothetical protein